MEEKKIKTLILCLANPSGSPRPKRIIALCKSLGHRVSVGSFETADAKYFDAHYQFCSPSMKIEARIGRKLLNIIGSVLPTSLDIKVSRWGLKVVKEQLKDKYFDIIIVEDFNLLSFAFSIKKDAKIIFDAREYHPCEFENSFWFMHFEHPEIMRICSLYLPKCDVVLTVSHGLAQRYKHEFSINPLLIRSTPDYYDTQVKAADFSNIRLVHHGVANRDRKLENMIDMFSLLDDRFSLDFYLTGSRSYQNELIRRANKNPKVRFLQPVPFDKIIPMLTDYDIGLYLLQPTGFNTEHCLPNKFFEFIQARLMLAIGPSPDMADLLRQYECGVIADDFKPQTMANLLNSLTAEEIMSKKVAANIAALDLNFEKECKKIIDMMSMLSNDVITGSRCA